jgi:predicted enzyme related to lactoylglutathione lyase
MKVSALTWAGTRTDRFDDTVRFFEDVMGIELEETQAGFAAFRLPGGDKFEVFGPEDPDHDFMTCPVVGFGVDDVDAARAELEGSGVEFIGATQRQGDYAWAHFRAPDGHVYEISSS